MKIALALLSVLLGVATAARGEDQTPPSSPNGSPSDATEAIDIDEASTPSGDAAVEDDSAGENRLIQEVIVTAQKREESLQSVPISVQAFSAETLDARGISKPSSLQLVTPGLQYNTQVGYAQIYIRGVGTEAFIPSADATVATYIDGIYYPFAQNVTSALGPIERVEVLKGPQGTLFGRNSTGGAINVVMKQPGPDLETAVNISRESYDATNIRMYTNIPLIETLSLALSGLRYSEESYYKLAATSPLDEIARDTTKAFQLKARWNPVEALSAILGYTYTNTLSGTATTTAAEDPKPLGRLLQITPSPDYQSSDDYPSLLDTVTRVVSADVSYASPWFDTKLILADQRATSKTNVDFDGSNMPVAVFTTPGQFANVKTAEFQILSNDDGWGADWLTWIGGLYYLKSSVGYDPAAFLAGPQLVRFLAEPGGLGISGQAEPLIDLLSGLPLADQLLPLVNGGARLNIDGILDTRSSAVFVQATAELSDWSALTLGGRYQTETRELVKSETQIVPITTTPASAVTVLSFGRQRAHSSNFSPKIVLDFKLFDDALLYFSYAKGFKSGTFNIANLYAPSDYVKPESVKSYELGYKDSLMGRTLRLSAAIFENRVHDVQGQIVSFTSGGAVKLINTGSGRIRGAEFDAQWQIFPQAFPGFVLNAAAAYLDGIYTHYPNGAGFDETSGLFFDGTLFPTRDFSGNKTVRTPKISGNVGLSYAWSLGPGSLEIAADGYYNSGFYFSTQNTPQSKQGGYSLIGAHASYLFDPWGVRATLFGENLADTKYLVYDTDTDFGTLKLLGRPATYGLRLSWSF